jgi:cell division protein FtsN
MTIPPEHPASANDPNRGMNVKLYLTVVGAAVIVIAIIAAIVIGSKAAKPAPTPQTTPTSQLSQPSKPSPIHPVVVASSGHPHAHGN